MSRQQHYQDDDPEAAYSGTGQHDSYYDQEYDSRQNEQRQSARSEGQYQDYDEAERYSQNGQYYEGDDDYYNQRRETYNSEDSRGDYSSRGDYYHQDSYADDYPESYPAGVDPYGTHSSIHG